MPSLLNKLKQSSLVQTVKAATISGKIIQVDRGAKAVVCKNHLGPDKKPMKIIIPVIPKMKEYICQCGTIYQFK